LGKQIRKLSTTGKNAKMAILKFAVIYFFTKDYYRVIPCWVLLLKMIKMQSLWMWNMYIFIHYRSPLYSIWFSLKVLLIWIDIKLLKLYMLIRTNINFLSNLVLTIYIRDIETNQPNGELIIPLSSRTTHKLYKYIDWLLSRNASSRDIIGYIWI
jgi:hypothetical protein